MNVRKTLVASAIGAAVGSTGMSANAAIVSITGLTLGDIGGDGTTSGFRFATSDPSFPNGSTLGFVFGATDEAGCIAGDCTQIPFGGTGGTDENIFTTGFNFGGNGPFAPMLSDTLTNPTDSGGAAGTIDTTNVTMDLTRLDFAGIYNPGVENVFLLAPETRNENANTNPWKFGSGSAVVTDPAFSTDSTIPIQLVSLTDNTDGTYNVIFNFTSLISSSNGDAAGTAFDGFISRWRVEGCVTTTAAAGECVIPPIPVPAAVWLFGSGLLGLVGVARRRKQKTA